MPHEPVRTTSHRDQRRRERGLLTLLVLATVLLGVLWLSREYLIPGGSSAEVGSVTTTSSVTPAAPAPPEYEADETSEVAEVRSPPGVPDVIGLMASDAIGTLERAGYVGSVRKVYSDSKPLGVVFEQVPAAGESPEPGSTVRMLVSEGEQPSASVTLPNLLGEKEAAAVDRLEGLGLDPKVMVQPRQDNAGRVFEQSPAAGTGVVEGSKVFLMVASSR